jgi:hypothetical protein
MPGRTVRDRHRCVHHNTTLNTCGSLWHNSVFAVPTKLIRPWVSNVRYTAQKYSKFKKELLAAESTITVGIGTSRLFSNAHALLGALGTLDTDIEMGDEVPCTTDLSCKYVVYSKAMCTVLRVYARLGGEAPYLSIEPIMVLPDEVGVYRLTATIDNLFFEVRVMTFIVWCVFSGETPTWRACREPIVACVVYL